MKNLILIIGGIWLVSEIAKRSQAPAPEGTPPIDVNVAPTPFDGDIPGTVREYGEPVDDNPDIATSKHPDDEEYVMTYPT